MQFLLRPRLQGWQKKVQEEAKKLINPKKRHGRAWWNPLTWVAFARPPRVYADLCGVWREVDGDPSVPGGDTCRA